tara:strand:+ start:350 stop:553 length:204 start_codon:yes stop_codon:yes gene_type:complete
MFFDVKIKKVIVINILALLFKYLISFLKLDKYNDIGIKNNNAITVKPPYLRAGWFINHSTNKIRIKK